MSEMMGKRSVEMLAAGLQLSSPASNTHATSPQPIVVLADTPKIMRWAVIHQAPDPAHNDPYYHAELFEHEKGAKPWMLKQLVQHMVITSKAMENSRNAKHARIYAYRDAEFWITYKNCRGEPGSRIQTPV